MKKNLKQLAIVLAATTAVSCGGGKEQTLMERAEELQRSILTMDTHCDTPMSLFNPNFDITKENGGCVDFPKMRAGSLDVESFAVFTSQRKGDDYVEATYAKAKKLYDTLNYIAKANSDKVMVVLSPDDMYKAKREGKLGLFLTMENSLPIGHDIARLDTLYNKGARMFGLCHSYNSDICDSSSDKEGSVYGGLSPLGEQVVEHLNQIGAVIDVSHASDESFFDVVKLSKTPIVASHSSVRAVTNHNRNFSDEMLEALKANGGVIQICILDDYIKEFPKNPEYEAELKVAREAFYKIPQDSTEAKKNARAAIYSLKDKYPDQNAHITDYVDHIEYVIKKIGVDYVGIGTDFDGGGGVKDCKDVSQLIGVTAELLSRGYSKEEIEKIWGGNYRRVFQQVIDYKESLLASK